MEHNSVLRPLYRREQAGCSLTVLPCDDKGRLRIEALEKALERPAKAVICTHASNLTGNLNDIRSIGRLCRAKGVLLAVDASQTAGVFPIDMEKDAIDILCFTGHKGLMGPQGTGGLCIREGIELDSLCVGGSGVRSYQKTHPRQMPERLEAGTLNVHGIAGLLAAAEWLEKTGIQHVREHEQRLTRRFSEQLREVPGIRMYGAPDEERTGIVALNLGDEDSEAVCDELAVRFGVAVRGGAHCAPLMHEALGTKEQGVVRFSFGWFNTEKEADLAAQAMKELAEELKTE